MRIRGSSHHITEDAGIRPYSAHTSLLDPKALLVVSGGYTSSLIAPSEGESYLRFARATGLLPPADRFPRTGSYERRQKMPRSTHSKRASPSSTTISSGVSSGNCATPSSTSRMWVSRSGLRQKSARRHRAKPVWLPRAPGPEARRKEPSREGPRLPRRCTGMCELLDWCPKDGTRIFPGTLPWVKE
ncbi:hypothetical protein EDB83DRAFT_1762452 [Lactarius deliciosus]|nr:hypothetical protein EDB83DRAFT_1762452 [Lactarius deliciosus]